MPLRILGTTAADRDRLVAVHGAAFFDPDTISADVRTASLDWARTFAASPDGGTTLAGVYTSYDMAVTVPGPLGSLVRVPMPGCPGSRSTPTTAAAGCCARWSPTTSPTCATRGPR